MARAARIYYRGSTRKAGAKNGQATFEFVKEESVKGKLVITDTIKKDNIKVSEQEIWNDKYYENKARGIKISLGLEFSETYTIPPTPDHELRYVYFKREGKHEREKKYQILRSNRMGRGRIWADLEEVK